MNRTMASLWQRVRRIVPPYTLFALALMMVSAGVVIWLMALDDQAESLRIDIVHKREAMRQVKPKVVRTIPLAEQVEAFVSALPSSGQTTDDIEQVFRIAKANQISLIKGEYKFTRTPGDPLARYTATFPVHASYVAIRNFSAQLLDALPHIAVDELRMNRVNADDTMLDSEIRLSFVYRR